jgi:hypothetical protein
VDDVPTDFDDSADPEGQVTRRRVESHQSDDVDVFAKMQAWLSKYDVLLIDLSRDARVGEPAPVCVTIYFRFEDPDEI